MKRIVVCICAIMLLLSLCACESKQEKEAKLAYSEKRYADVVSVMEGETTDDPELLDMLTFSQAVISYEGKDYQTVVKLLENKSDDDPECLDMLAYSKANIAFAADDYDSVLQLIGADEHYSDDEIVMESWERVFTNTFDNADAEAYSEYAKMNGAPIVLALEIITDHCNDFDYDAFLFLDEVIDELSEGELLNNLTAYNQENMKTRTKAFLKGTWEWQMDQDTKSLVEIHVSDDDNQCVGYLTQVGDDLIRYSYHLGEVYWKEFVFDEEGKLVSMYNLTKLAGGQPVGSNAIIDIYFESDTMLIGLQKRNWFYNSQTVTPDRTWVKISDNYLSEQP